MISGLAADGILSLLLDVLPPVILAALAVSFFRGRHRLKEEERELKDAIQVFEEDTVEESERETCSP